MKINTKKENGISSNIFLISNLCMMVDIDESSKLSDALVGDLSQRWVGTSHHQCTKEKKKKERTDIAGNLVLQLTTSTHAFEMLHVEFTLILITKKVNCLTLKHSQ